MPTRNTTKQGLAFSIDLVAAATDVARPRGVARVNRRAWRPCEQRLVGDKDPQLPKSPIVMTCALRVPNFYPFAHALESLKHNPATGAWSTRNQRLTDAMICVGLKAALFAAEFLQRPFRSLRSCRLEARTTTRIPCAPMFNLLPAVDVLVAVGRQVDDAKVHTKRTINLVRWWLVNVARHQQKESALAIHQVAFALSRLQKLALALTGNERHALTTAECPDRERLLRKLKRENTVIVGNAAVGFVCALCLALELVTIANFRKASNDHLRRKAILGADTMIRQRLKVELPKGLLLPCNAADVIAGGVGTFKRTLQCVGLLRRRK